MLQYAPFIHIAGTAQDFIACCVAALSDTQPARVQARIEEGRKSSWDARVGEICAVLEEKVIF